MFQYFVGVGSSKIYLNIKSKSTHYAAGWQCYVIYWIIMNGAKFNVG